MANLRTSGVFSLGSLGGDGTAIPGDDNWNDVTLLLDGSSTTDLSGSSTVTPSASGYTTNNTTGAKFNQYIDFENSPVGYFNVAFPSALGVSDEPFTVETWAYFDAISNDGVFQLYQGSSKLDGTNVQANASIATAVSSGTFIFYDYGNANTSLGSAATGTWYHIAVVYDGTDLVFYVDGTALKTTTRSMPAGGWTSIGIGGYFSTTYLMDGRIEGFRVTKGVARYTAAFNTDPVITSPTAWHTATPVGVTRPTRRWGGITGRSITTSGGASLENTGVMTLAEHYQYNLSIPPGDGLSAATAGDSALQILTDYPSSTDGIYYIRDGAGTKQVYCDMTNGGWMLYTSFATNSTYDATTYPAWNGNQIGSADMRGGSPQYGWTDNSDNGRDGTTTWSSGSGETQQNGNDGPVYMFWNYGGTEQNQGVEMTQWNGPSSITELRVGWGKGASSYSATNLANYLLVNNTASTSSPKDSVSDIIENVSFNPTGATPLLLCYELDGTTTNTQGINGISSVWMR